MPEIFSKLVEKQPTLRIIADADGSPAQPQRPSPVLCCFLKIFLSTLPNARRIWLLVLFCFLVFILFHLMLNGNICEGLLLQRKQAAGQNSDPSPSWHRCTRVYGSPETTLTGWCYISCCRRETQITQPGLARDKECCSSRLGN